METGERIAAEALALLGTPFGLHGRSVESGLDCVGLAALALAQAGRAPGVLPAYRLRGMSVEAATQALEQAGLAPVPRAMPGDILLARSGPMQLHLLLLTGRGLVHADAGLGRVVLMPAPGPWPVLGQWRARPSIDQGS
ncbi:MAG: hypothetical protein ABS86_02540 [Sphingobium sp. SCN 64-10]|nr:MAG: hypothetical protein ABS86_02540 [Sphingobium sp. SCN 64-10]